MPPCKYFREVCSSQKYILACRWRQLCEGLASSYCETFCKFVQAELEAAIALSKATALEEQMHKGGDDLPWWEVSSSSHCFV